MSDLGRPLDASHSVRPKVRVVKFGGSLFNDGYPAEKIAAWLDNQTPAVNIAITGGGRWADSVRELDARAKLPVVVGHRLAVRSMSLLTWLISFGDDAWQRIDRIQDVEAAIENGKLTNASRLIWFDVRHFLDEVEPARSGQTLPIGWQTTSDSIAARLAVILAADELVLFKSVAPPRVTMQQLAAQDYVDEHFPLAIADFRGEVRLVA